MALILYAVYLDSLADPVADGDGNIASSDWLDWVSAVGAVPGSVESPDVTTNDLVLPEVTGLGPLTAYRVAAAINDGTGVHKSLTVSVPFYTLESAGPPPVDQEAHAASAASGAQHTETWSIVYGETHAAAAQGGYEAAELFSQPGTYAEVHQAAAASSSSHTHIFSTPAALGRLKKPRLRATKLIH